MPRLSTGRVEKIVSKFGINCGQNWQLSTSATSRFKPDFLATVLCTKIPQSLKIYPTFINKRKALHLSGGTFNYAHYPQRLMKLQFFNNQLVLEMVGVNNLIRSLPQ